MGELKIIEDKTMKLINPRVEQWHCGYTLPEIWSHIVKCARVCYQSEPRSNGETDEEFAKRVILRNHSFEEIAESRELQLKLHLSVLEHGTVYLDIPNNIHTVGTLTIFKNNKYSKTWQYGNFRESRIAVTTNMRVIVENGLIDTLQYMCPPIQYHTFRTTFNIITDIGVARELDRHRSHSISEESSRFCNYSKDKFNNELTFIKPNWLNVYISNVSIIDDDIYDNEVGAFDSSCSQPLYEQGDIGTKNFLLGLCNTEKAYFTLLGNNWTPQQARQVLPLSTKVQTIHTAFNDDWEEFIKLRADACSGSVHPNMRVIAESIKDLMSKANG